MLMAAIRDPIVGPSLTVGIGGWAAEAGHIFFTVPLPVEANAFAGHVAGSALAGLLNERQSGALIEVLEAVGTAFVGDAMAGFDVLECNPVILTEQGGVVADVLILRTAAGKSTASH